MGDQEGKDEAIKSARKHYGSKWPEELWTGVMFYHGYRITIQEFNLSSAEK